MLDNGVWRQHLSESACLLCLQVVAPFGPLQGPGCGPGSACSSVQVAGGLGAGGINAGRVEWLFHAALHAKLPGAGHLVAECALPTSQRVVAIEEASLSVLEYEQ